MSDHKTTAKGNLGNAVWRATLAASEFASGNSKHAQIPVYREALFPSEFQFFSFPPEC
jgi:hypothetical protein